MEKRTPLYAMHEKYHGKIVDFAGWALPVQYATGVKKEHMAVREACGLFDVSHMGEITCKGEGALACLNHLLTNDFTSMVDGKARYSVMCYEDGGCVDDLIVYKVQENDYFIVVNAANKDKDYAWMKEHEEGCTFEDISDSIAQIAIQGPLAKEILSTIVKEEDFPTKYYSANFNATVSGIPCILSKTGYTGSDGYEIYVASEKACTMYEALMQAGQENIMPCGLGARDTLRLEAAMPLYGHEMDETVTPLEANLGFAVKLNKDFIGKEALLSETKRMRIGLKVTGKGIAREHMDVTKAGQLIGHTTSGTYAPYLGYSIAMALVDAHSVEIGDEVEIDIRGKKVSCQVVPMPFYQKPKKAKA